VHLPNQQSVLFNARSNPSEILSTAIHTKLTRFFEVCRNNPEAAGLLYSEFPKFFRWKKGAWHRRKKSGNKVIERLYYCPPNDPERFCLRLLLCHIRGPKSFENLRTVDSVIYLIFKQAAQQLGLLESDDEWFNCLSEASLFQMPSQLRLLFATILVYCQPAGLGQNTTPEDSLIISHALLEIEGHIRQCGKSLEDFPELPAIHYDLLDCNRQTQLFIEETTFPQDKLQQILEGVSLLNDEQRAIYDAVELINYIYSDLQTRWNDCQYLLERAILTTKNQGVAEINNLILSDFP
ncbi:3266_t:CDS:2, partial [Dentiscutata heterogama]